MSFSKKGIFGVGAALATVGAALFLWHLPVTEPASGVSISPTRTIRVGGMDLRVEIADTSAKRQQGLSGISHLAPGEGMLFVFEQDGQHSFWMKDMLISIDMLWIAVDGTVVHLESSVSPTTFPQSFTSTTSARYVLEVPAGFATEHGIGVGTSIEF